MPFHHFELTIYSMKNVNDRRGIFILLFISIAGIFILLSDGEKPVKKSDQEKLETKTLSVIHSLGLKDLELINNAYLENKEFIQRPNGKVFGGIVPHHYSIAASVIAGFYEGISSQQVDTIIVLGPDHFNTAKHPIVTSLESFPTLFGIINPENNLITSLLKYGGVFVEELPFETEHSIYSQLPFIKKTFPNAKIVPLIINISATKEDADKLSDSIAKYLKENSIKNILVLASVDFVHYLDSVEADRLDKESILAFATLKPEKVLGLTDQLNLDSKISVYTLFKTMEALGVNKTQLVVETNSGNLSKPPFTEKVVSYISLYLLKDKN